MYKKNELQEIPNTPRPLNSTGFKKKKKIMKNKKKNTNRPMITKKYSNHY